MLTKERAIYLLTHRSYCDLKFSYDWHHKTYGDRSSVIPSGWITEEEYEYAREVWHTMPGNTCLMDAISRIAREID